MDEEILLLILKDFDNHERANIFKCIKLQHELKDKGDTEGYIEKDTAT